MQHITPPANWHTETQNRMRTLTLESLNFIVRDCIETAELQWSFNPKASMYRDEALYASQEILRRTKKAVKA